MPADRQYILEDPISEADWPIGSPDAPVQLVEFGDYDCPDCSVAFAIVERLLEDKGDRIYFAFRHFPLIKRHPRALAAAIAAEAAGRQGKFWPMHRLIFATERNRSDEDLERYAAGVGCDIEQWKRDFLDKEIEREILRRRMHGLKSGVTFIPSFFIQGKFYEGEVTLEGLAGAVDYFAAGGE